MGSEPDDVRRKVKPFSPVFISQVKTLLHVKPFTVHRLSDRFSQPTMTETHGNAPDLTDVLPPTSCANCGVAVGTHE